MAAPLLQINDPQGLRLVTIDKPVYTIGRRSTADLQVAGADISRDHAEILQSGELYRVHDKGSRYGTFVNGEEVIERELNHGDRIRLGKSDAVELVFLTGGKETSGLREATSGAADLRQMAGLLDGLRALGSGRVLDEVLTLVMDSALDVTPADRGFLMLANQDGDLEFKTARAKGRVTLPGTTFATSTKIPREVFHTGQSRIVGDLMDGDLPDLHGRTLQLGIRHVLCVPLRIVRYDAASNGTPENRVIGVLYLDGREKRSLLSRATQSSLESSPPRRPWRSTARGCTPRRRKRCGSNATCWWRPRSSAPCSRSRGTRPPTWIWPPAPSRAGPSAATSTTTWTSAPAR
jgi:hypothetical protein